jgi:hypothetical protein
MAIAGSMLGHPTFRRRRTSHDHDATHSKASPFRFGCGPPAAGRPLSDTLK